MGLLFITSPSQVLVFGNILDLDLDQVLVFVLSSVDEYDDKGGGGWLNAACIQARKIAIISAETAGLGRCSTLGWYVENRNLCTVHFLVPLSAGSKWSAALIPTSPFTIELELELERFEIRVRPFGL